MYRVEFSKNALKQLKKTDKPTAALILGWIRKNLENCDDPRIYGKALIGDKKGIWRYRVGNFRILSKIEDEKCIILVVNVGHRKDIYRE